MISGARHGSLTGLRRLFAWAEARTLAAFVVPGVEVARAHGLDFPAVGLAVAATPRHANVLVIVGDLPANLAPAVAVTFAQMPRPRAVLAIGVRSDATLPAPDVSVPLEQAALAAAVAELRRRFAAGAWATDVATPLALPEVTQPDEPANEMAHMSHAMGDGHDDHADTGGGRGKHSGGSDHDGEMHMHAHHTPLMQDQGSREEADAGQHEVHGGDGASHHHDATPREGDASMSHAEHDAVGDAMPDAQAHGDHGMQMEMGAMHGDHAGHCGMSGMHGGGHGDMDMGMDMSGGFMSMIAVTRDMPRSPDGLPMEWLDVPLGPLFSGLPSGLALTFTLDGDAVAGVRVVPRTTARDIPPSLRGPVAGFPERLARLDPLAPDAYRVLAWRALDAVRGDMPAEPVQRERVVLLERTRVLSHFNWLASFAALLGMEQLVRETSRLHHALWHAQDEADIVPLVARGHALVRRYERTPLLAMRLRGVGILPIAASARGPVGRASGEGMDARRDDLAYRALAFAPVISTGNDALARLRVRLGEIAQSLTLMQSAGFPAASGTVVPDAYCDGTAAATVETPRGAATLHVKVANGIVTMAHLDGPSAVHLGLIETLTKGHDVADALLAVASLDLSPWEVDA